MKHKCFESAVFARLLFLNKQLFPTVFSQGFQGLDIFFEDHRGCREGGDGFFDTGFAQQLQHRVARAVGVVGDVIGRCSGELIFGVKAGDLDFSFRNKRGIKGVSDAFFILGSLLEKNRR